MDTVAVLIAKGGNDLEVPCRLFENMEVGKARCDEIFSAIGVKGETTKNGSVYYNVDLEDVDKSISEELFTGFYYGCGGVYGLILKEIAFDTKFVGFDLD